MFCSIAFLLETVGVRGGSEEREKLGLVTVVALCGCEFMMTMRDQGRVTNALSLSLRPCELSVISNGPERILC